MSIEKERAFRYDLFITPDWRDRFDCLVNESIELPSEGRVLDLNSGTGAHAIELAEGLRGKGEIVGIDPSEERIELARGKALAKKLENVTFQKGIATDVPFSDGFDLVIGDASLIPADEIEDLLTEMARVVEPDGRVILKMTTHGSFDEFFSIFWEALLEANLTDQTWGALEHLINERVTVSDAELMAKRHGLRNVETFNRKEEFTFENAQGFLTSPLIEDFFFDDWISIVPEDRRLEVQDRIASLIDRERHGGTFDVSIKATVVSGIR